MNDYYYSTQTTLADRIARDFYGQYFVYVAVEYDPPRNDPTSNPRIIRERWCALSASLSDNIEPGVTLWEDYKQRLKDIFRAQVPGKTVLDDRGLKALAEIGKANASDASPIVYLIPRNAIPASRVHLGDAKGSLYPENMEYIIEDLRDTDQFSKDRTPCGEELELSVVDKG